MNQNTDAGKLPGWTLLASLLGSLFALMILWACRDFGLSWWIGAPAALVIVVVGALLDRTIERKYCPPRHTD